MAAILQRVALVKYQIFDMALEIAERTFQCICCDEKREKKSRAKGTQRTWHWV